MLDESQIHRALSLRAIGGTYASISSQTGISVSSLQIIFKKYALEKGEVSDAVFKRAKQELMDDTEIAEMMRLSLKTLILSEIQLGKRLLDSASITISQLNSVNPIPRAKVLSSISAVITSASNIMRRSLGAIELESVEIPTLSIRKMTEEEEGELKASKEINSPSNGEEIEIVIEELA